ncbi:MAG: hypothetical protein E7546_07605 [Ruminococcaceae bacterium]|nr:hypothetical protein [Oscillospiraceae bacterium]
MSAVINATDRLIYEVYEEAFGDRERYGIEALIVERRAFPHMFDDRDCALEVARVLNANSVTLQQAPYVIEDCIFGKKHDIR